MATTSNPRKSTQYPQKFNQRENKASTSNYTLVEIDDGDSPYTVSSSDATSFIITDGGSGAVEVRLPPEAESLGRCISVRTSDSTADTTVENTSGGSTFATLAVTEEWVELFCDGTTWKITKSKIA